LVVREYYDRPPLFIPFSTIFDIIALIKVLYQWYLRVRYNYANPTQRVFSKLTERMFIVMPLLFLEVIAVQPELELAWQEFESASTYAYAQREALTKTDRSAMIETETSLRESGTSGSRPTDAVEHPGSSVSRKEKDAVIQLRNEFKVAIRDLRHDVSGKRTMINSLFFMFLDAPSH
jgi:hypothetical protein